MDIERKNLIERVTKLLALAESTQHSEEADTARTMAIELMAKHNIKANENLANEAFTIYSDRTGFPMEDALVLAAIAKLNNAYLLAGKDSYTVAGRQSDIIAFYYMTDLVMQQRVRAHNEFAASLPRWTHGERDRWLMGFAIGVCRKVKQLQDAVTTKQRGWGLVPVTRQYAHIVDSWVEEIGLDPANYGTHSMRRTKASLIYRRTKNLRAVQLLLGHTKLESTVRYLGIEVDDALELAEQTEV
jgi:hypothetical protein